VQLRTSRRDEHGRAIFGHGAQWRPRRGGENFADSPTRGGLMSISDLVSGKVTEPLSVLALVGEGTV